MTRHYTFHKKERLSNEVRIDRLFNAGETFMIHPFKVFLMVQENLKGVPVEVLIAVSKRKFKRAVDRNHIRRKIKEAYRLNKSILFDEAVRLNKCINLGIVYIGDEHEPDYHYIEKRIIHCLVKAKDMVSS